MPLFCEEEWDERSLDYFRSRDIMSRTGNVGMQECSRDSKQCKCLSVESWEVGTSWVKGLKSGLGKCEACSGDSSEGDSI